MTIGAALVTGASRGIGRAIALRLADDGFDIAVNDLVACKEDVDAVGREIFAKGRKVCRILGDVTEEGDVEAMIACVVEDLGGLDVMVANAGVCFVKPILDTTAAEWDRVFAVNARGMFLCYKYAGQQMINQGRGGRIIGACSIYGMQGDTCLSAYSSSRFAVRGVTQAAAKEFGPHGITVNAYAPGAIDTPLMRSLGDLTGDRGAFYQQEANESAVGRMGTPDEVASLVSYLASKEAHFITGQCISVNGGQYCD